MNKEQIGRHLKLAIGAATPDVLESILVNLPPQGLSQEMNQKVVRPFRWKMFSGLAAACMAVMVLIGGVYTFNTISIASVIEIDVNPSIELSVNRSNKIIKAEPLNDDAIAILDNMDLKGVDLDIAVNAVIGSMVQHGYLDQLENSILVTVSNNDEKKATSLREELVNNIETSLAANKVSAIVYNQQVSESKEVLELAEQYDISYGKAYFLAKLIAKDSSLTMDELAPLTMDAIAKLVAEKGIDISDLTMYEYGESVAENIATSSSAEERESSTEASSTVPTDTLPTETSTETVTIPDATAPTQTVPPTTTAPTEESTEGDSSKNTIKIDWVDYDTTTGLATIYFKNKVSFNNPTVSVTDVDGNAYASLIYGHGSDYCDIQVKNLPQGKEFKFSLGGIKNLEGGKYTTIKGVFDTPVMETAELKESTSAPTQVPTSEQTKAPTSSEVKPAEEGATVLSSVSKIENH